jgi:hypothetical protein
VFLLRLSELGTQIELCHILGFFDPSYDTGLTAQVDTFDSLLSGLIRFEGIKSNRTQTQEKII